MIALSVVTMGIAAIATTVMTVTLIAMTSGVTMIEGDRNE